METKVKHIKKIKEHKILQMLKTLFITLLCLVLLSMKTYSQTPEEDIFRLENSYEAFAKSMDSAFAAFVENRENEYKKWIEEEKEWIKITLAKTYDVPVTSTNNTDMPTKETEPNNKINPDKEGKNDITKTKESKKPNDKKKIKKEHEQSNKVTETKTKKDRVEKEKKITKIKFVKPIKIKYRFSADFGYRIHPIFKVKKFHYGIDMGCATGTKIYAVMGGTVVVSRLSKGYGNFVIIQHTNNLKTIYAHMSKRLVKKGDVVKQNDVIGLVGSTGRSTGPHLHFEVVENNKKIHPKKYIKL